MKSLEPFITEYIGDLQERGIGGPFFVQMPCGKRVWFNEWAEILPDTQVFCMRLFRRTGWHKSAMDMVPSAYKAAKSRLLNRIAAIEAREMIAHGGCIGQ